MDLGGEVDEGNKIDSLWEVDKGNWINSLWELMKEIDDHV
jgi:hypothetical protein